MPQREPEVYEVPIEWHVSENVACHYATNIVVQHTDHEFIVSFFEAVPPILLGTPEDLVEQLKELDSIRHECVARVTVAAGRMPDFVSVLQKNLETYLSTREGADHKDAG